MVNFQTTHQSIHLSYTKRKFKLLAAIHGRRWRGRKQECIISTIWNKNTNIWIFIRDERIKLNNKFQKYPMFWKIIFFFFWFSFLFSLWVFFVYFNFIYIINNKVIIFFLYNKICKNFSKFYYIIEYFYFYLFLFYYFIYFYFSTKFFLSLCIGIDKVKKTYVLLKYLNLFIDYKVCLSISEVNRLINIQMLTISYTQNNIIES